MLLNTDNFITLGNLLGSVAFSVFAAVSFQLVRPIIWPNVIAYPWEEEGTNSNDKSKSQDDKKRTVIIAGSYNPPHLGHKAMIEYLSKRYGKVIIVIGYNPLKKYLVSAKERAKLLQEMMADDENDNVQIKVVSGYIWRFAKRENATIFFRGIRSWAKDGKEERALQILNTWGPMLLGPLVWPIPTIYLEGKPEYNHISSTLIRNIVLSSASSNEEANTTSRNSSANSQQQESSLEETLSKLVDRKIAGSISKLYGRDQK